MKHIAWHLAFLLPLIASACGKSNEVDNKETEILAPIILGSAYQAMLFVGQSVDPSLRTSTLYQYHLNRGSIKSLSTGEAANASLFSDGTNVLLFNRQEEQESFRVITPGRDATVGPLYPLALSPGDPFDLASVTAGESVILAEPLGGKLRFLNYQNAVLSTLNLSQKLAVNPLRPIGLSRAGDQFSVLHTGLTFHRDGSATSDRSQQVFKLRVESNASFSFQDQNTATPEIDGIPLTGTNPSGFLGEQDSKATILSLCSPRIQPCTAAMDTLDAGRVTKSQLWEEHFPYSFLGQIINGSSVDDVFAHVSSRDGRSLVIKIHLPTRGVEEIHTFADERLYGIAFDVSSGTLFIGGVEEGFGTLTVYPPGKKPEKITFDSVFYRSAFINY